MKIQGCFICESTKYHFFWKKNGFNIVQCDLCDFIYVDPLPLKNFLNKFYKTFEYKNVIEAEKVIRKDAIRSLTIIEQYQQKGVLLDLGCGGGFFMDEARKRGWKVFGIDYATKVIKYAKEKLRLDVKHADMFMFKSKRKFDVVALNQVIEHVSKPNDLVRRCYDLLNRGGIIYITTPNISSLAAKVAGKDFDYIIPPEHLGYYNKKTLTKLFERNGFAVAYSGSWGYRQDLAGIIKRLLEKKKQIQVMNKVHNMQNEYKLPFSKRMKYLIFDVIFCGLFYRILSFDHLGSNVEIIGVKQ